MPRQGWRGKIGRQVLLMNLCYCRKNRKLFLGKKMVRDSSIIIRIGAKKLKMQKLLIIY